MRRYLVIANQTLGGHRLLQRARELCEEGPCAFHVVVPVTEPRNHVHRVEAGSGEELARQRLDSGLERFREIGIEATGEIGSPQPLECVRDALDRDDYDAIIVSTLPAGVSRWLGMDLPSRIERDAGIPVEHIEALTELLPEGRLGGVAVGVDGSPGSVHALRWAIDEAEMRGLRLAVIHVFSYVAETTVAAPDVPFAFAGPPYEEVEADARQLLDRVIEQVDTRGVPLTRHAVEGDPARMLLRAAAGADLLVVGATGHGGLAGIGSVSRQVTEDAPCPVVIVPG